MRKNNFFLETSLLLMVILAIPFAAAASNQNAAYYLQQLTNGLTSLFAQGDTTGFIRGLTGSFPLIAVFMIVLGVVQFISAEVIFKQQQKYATILAIGMALITVSNQGIFNWILGLGSATLFVIFSIVLVILVFEPIIRGKTKGLEMSKLNTEIYSSRANEVKMRSASIKELQNEKVEKSLEAREDESLAGAEQLLKDMEIKDYEIEAGLKNVLNIIGKIESVRNESVKAQYTTSLRQQLAAMSAKITAKKTETDRAEGLSKKLLHYAANEMSMGTALNRLSQQVYKRAKSTPGAKDDNIARAVNNQEVQLESLIQRERGLVQKLKQLQDEQEAYHDRLVEAIKNGIDELSTDRPGSAVGSINQALTIVRNSILFEKESESICRNIYALNKEEENLITTAINEAKSME